MSNVLTDEEKREIRDKVSKASGEWHFDLMLYANEIERAVLAKAGEQEPVAWIVRCKRSGLIEQAEPNEKATNPDYWTDSFPVYAHPLPAQAIPEGIAQTVGYIMDGWVFDELTKHWGEGISSHDTRRAAKTVLSSISVIRDAMLSASPKQ